jgi:hypothetical protein
MRRVAASWWDHAQFPTSLPPGAFHDYTIYNDSNRAYIDLHHPHRSLDRGHWMNPITATTMDSPPPPPDALIQMVTAMDHNSTAAATTMSVTEEALRNYMAEREEEERQRRVEQQQQQLASYAQLQLFSTAHRHEFLQHQPFALYPPPIDPYLQPSSRSLTMYNPHHAFLPVTPLKKPPPKRKRMKSPKKKAADESSACRSILTETEKKTISEKESTGGEDEKASTNRLKPIPDDDATTHSSKCEPKPNTASPAAHCIKPRAKKPRTAVAKSSCVPRVKPAPLSALRSLSKHEVAKAVQWIAIPPPLFPTYQLLPPTPTPTKEMVPILPRGRVISPWTEDAPRSEEADDDEDPLWHLLREDDIWSLSSSSSSGRRSPAAAEGATWNDDPEMVSLLCDALDL